MVEFLFVYEYGDYSCASRVENRLGKTLFRLAVVYLYDDLFSIHIKYAIPVTSICTLYIASSVATLKHDVIQADNKRTAS